MSWQVGRGCRQATTRVKAARKSGKTAKGNRWLRRVLVQAAWGGVRKKNSYVAAQFGRLAARRGKKRIVAPRNLDSKEADFKVYD